MKDIKKSSGVTEYPNVYRKSLKEGIKEYILGNIELIIFILGVLLSLTYFGRLYFPVLFSTDSSNFVESFLGLVGFGLVFLTILLIILALLYNFYKVGLNTLLKCGKIRKKRPKQ